MTNLAGAFTIENQKACRFYEKLGGDVVGNKKNIREDGVVLVEVAYGWHDPGALVQRDTPGCDSERLSLAQTDPALTT